MKRLIITLFYIFLILAANSQEKRLALVIGNSNYMYGGTLANPENDADSISQRLIKLGFNVLTHKNLEQKSMQRVIDDFGLLLKHYEVGLFFYAGHGIQAKGTNYLIPVDANIRTENDVEYTCVKTGRILAKMEDAGSKLNIIILDACRDNPFERQWTRSTTGRGLAFMNSPVGTLIAYSTAPGQTASDGYETNSPYTSALINYINQPEITILQMFQYVRKDVRQKTNNLQIPWESTSLEGNFYFAAAKKDLPVTTTDKKEKDDVAEKEEVYKEIEGTTDTKAKLKKDSVFVSGCTALVTDFSIIDDKFAHLLGGGGRFFINDFFFGGYGIKIINNIKFQDTTSLDNYNHGFKHGGLWVGYSFMSNRLFYPTVSLQLGWGKIADHLSSNIFDETDVDFFVIIPAIELEANISQILRISIGINYRFVDNIDYQIYTESYFNSPGVFMSVKLGWFSN